jgi:hypothetical protein
MRKSLMALRKLLILRKLRSSCLEGRTAPIQQILNSFTGFFAGDKEGAALQHPNASEHEQSLRSGYSLARTLSPTSRTVLIGRVRHDFVAPQ